MTTGIYALYWAEQDLIYIGQSQDIDRRFTEHLYKLKNNKHTNYKVQNTYNLHGIPKLVVIQKCGIEELNTLEIYYTKEFNSLVSGLNLIEAGTVGWGSNSNSSKYSKIKLLKVFSLLYRTNLTIPRISSLLDVNQSLVTDIRLGKSHLWLQDSYPEKYTKMLLNRSLLSRANQVQSITVCRKEVRLIDSNGTVYTINGSIPEFCRTIPEFNTSSIRQHYEGIARVVRKERKSHRGWKLYGY